MTDKAEITKDTLIADILEINAEKAAPIFFAMGMHCLGCAAAHGESIADAAAVHGHDASALIADLNKALFA
ncbi:MAG: DUF1858 domain-containing protein [Oscillospiraceae bacterium]|jgi:hybrid cluster-associated redox disulfide protein|nr:DUF1858 domain-containing protein [Oscillospiraceae bacterium]